MIKCTSFGSNIPHNFSFHLFNLCLYTMVDCSYIFWLTTLFTDWISNSLIIFLFLVNLNLYSMVHWFHIFRFTVFCMYCITNSLLLALFFFSSSVMTVNVFHKILLCNVHRKNNFFSKWLFYRKFNISIYFWNKRCSLSIKELLSQSSESYSLK
jgi:hypothetical protein